MRIRGIAFASAEAGDSAHPALFLFFGAVNMQGNGIERSRKVYHEEAAFLPSQARYSLNVKGRGVKSDANGWGGGGSMGGGGRGGEDSSYCDLS